MCVETVGPKIIEPKYPNNVDIAAKRKEYYFKPPSYFDSLLIQSVKDERDLPIAYLFFNIFVVTIPAAAFVFYCQSNWIGFFYWASNLLLFHERFILGFHYSSHRGLFKNSVANQVTPWILSPFFGIPSGIYYIHHCIMHHVENNLDKWDVSSTEPYQRDNFFHFLHYWLRFLLAIWVELPYYAWKRGRHAMACGAVGAILSFWTAVLFLHSYNKCGAFWVFIWPTIAGSFLLSEYFDLNSHWDSWTNFTMTVLGNWSQHVFINPSKSRCNYHLTYNVINADFNQRTFNDGYHIEHHIHSKRHWTEVRMLSLNLAMPELDLVSSSQLPTNFMANISKYEEEDAVIFQGLDFIGVGVLVFLRQYKILASHLVQLREPRRSPEEVERFLRARLVPIRIKAD